MSSAFMRTPNISRAGMPEARHRPTNTELMSVHLPALVSSSAHTSPVPQPLTLSSRFMFSMIQS